MFAKKLIIGLLSFYAVNVRRLSKTVETESLFEEAIHRSVELVKKKKTERKKTRLYQNKKWNKKKSYAQKHYKIEGTSPKDVRFSNQGKLRRMYRNC